MFSCLYFLIFNLVLVLGLGRCCLIWNFFNVQKGMLGMPDTQEIIGPSPIKPKRLSMSSKLRLGARARGSMASPLPSGVGAPTATVAVSASTTTSYSSTTKDDLAEGADISEKVSVCRLLRDSIARTAAFNKLATRMTADDVQRHYSWRDQLRDSFAALFMIWDLRGRGPPVAESVAGDVDMCRICAKKINERIR